MENILKIKVEGITSPRSGEAVRNQFVIKTDNKTCFQSYNSLIAIWDGEKLILGKDWDYSVTTMKWLYEFIRDYCWKIYSHLQSVYGACNSKSIRKEIENGLKIEYNENIK